MIKTNTLSLNVDACMADLKEHYKTALKEAENKFIEIIDQEVVRPNVGGGPGKPGWREAAKEHMNVLEERFVDNYLEADVGYDMKGAFSDFVKTMLILQGGGSAAPGGSPITAGPPGRSVWDNNLDGKHPSSAKSEYTMPDGWNQPGNKFMENAVRRMQTFFYDIIDSANAKLPDSVFYDNVMVSAG